MADAADPTPVCSLGGARRKSTRRGSSRSRSRSRSHSTSERAGPRIVNGVVQSHGRIPKKVVPHPTSFKSDHQAAEYAKTVHPGDARAARKLLYRFVWDGACKATTSGLTQKDLMLNKQNTIVSKLKSKVGKANKGNLRPAPLFKRKSSRSKSATRRSKSATRRSKSATRR